MPAVDQAAMINASRTMLRPFASLLLKCGLTWREFAEIAKSVFVEVATDEYGIGGRPTNVSRVSILTGMSRKEVRRQRDLLAEAESLPVNKTSGATHVLSGWHQDPDFLTADGQPRKLDPESDGNEFPELCRRYAIEIPATTMLKELKRVGAVEKAGDGKFSVMLRYYMPTQFDPQWVLNAGDYLADLTNTINHNIDLEEGAPTHFLGRATEPEIDSEDVEAFRQFVDAQGQQFLETIDAWLAAHQYTDADKADRANKKDVKPVRLGVGLFLIKGEAQKRSD